MTTKRVESLRAPCLDASSTLATSTKNSSFWLLFFVEVIGVTYPPNPLSVKGACRYAPISSTMAFALAHPSKRTK